MITIEEIKRPIQIEFDEFSKKFEDSIHSKSELLSSVNGYVAQKRGKQIRPILTLLSAKNCGEINNDTIKAAIALEMLHTASLMHDDVVDDSNERRGQTSVNILWTNKIAILFGDYILSQSLAIANEIENREVINQITRLGKEISEGELLQITNVKNINCDEEKYIEVIKKKTATLFSTCTYTGAITTNCTLEEAEKMRKFGEIYGICFQIRDDIFDYIASEKEIGKPIGNDIREGKITLPLLYALNNCSSAEKEEHISILKKKEFTTENIQKLIKFAIAKGGIEYAEQKMISLKNDALKLIEGSQNVEVRNSLVKVLEHTIERKK